FSHWAINRALSEKGATFNTALSGMVIANRIMTSVSATAADYTYEEAAAYPVTGPRVFKNEYFITGQQDTILSLELERFASQYVSVVTSTPVKIDLTHISGPASDLIMHAIMKKEDGSYKIISGPSLNIDPVGVQSIYLAVVSQDTTAKEWDYYLVFQDGKPGTNPLVPEEFLLSNPYPNPFNGRSQFSIYMFEDRIVDIDVVDLSGRQIAQIWNGELTAGNHILSWNGKTKRGHRAASGVYFLTVRGTKTQEWKKLTLVK
ncbi:MAG: T9SS type A sorting domain-containing protein, partial [Fidelibacterota bacterium]